jgi:membrane protein implicated in regulation of membrane protease activity
VEQETVSLRRGLGLACLIGAAVMVIVGETALHSSLDGVPFLIYWLICFLFTFAAIAIALSDLRSVRRRSREEKLKLLRKTFGELDPIEEPKSHGCDEPG